MNQSIPETKLIFLKKKVTVWGRNNYVAFPWRETRNKWHAIVGEIMVQRTRAEQAIPVYNEFCRKFSSPLDYLKRPIPVFKRLGLHWRDKKLRKLIRIISKEGIPKNKTALLALPGIGDYIASAFLSLHAGVRESLIDSNIVRFYGRFFGFDTNQETRRKKWFRNLAESVTPGEGFREFNYGLIDFTRAVCKVRPKCEMCCLKKSCHYLSTAGSRVFPF